MWLVLDLMQFLYSKNFNELLLVSYFFIAGNLNGLLCRPGWQLCKKKKKSVIWNVNECYKWETVVDGFAMGLWSTWITYIMLKFFSRIPSHLWAYPNFWVLLLTSGVFCGFPHYCKSRIFPSNRCQNDKGEKMRCVFFQGKHFRFQEDILHFLVCHWLKRCLKLWRSIYTQRIWFLSVCQLFLKVQCCLNTDVMTLILYKRSKCALG